jgi:histidine ammonia-lyase
MSKTISLDGHNLDLDTLNAVASGAPVSIARGVRKKIDQAQKFVQSIARGNTPAYGINTGFGFFARKKISHEELEALQVNLLKSHASGYGKPLSEEETRAAMVLRLNVLIKGYTGVRYEVCQALVDMINADIYPIIPEYGSVGASGDLAPLAHLALPLIGLGRVMYQGKEMDASTALKKAKLSPIKLEEKEGLGLINGTQVMLSVGGLALVQAQELLTLANQICALTYEGMGGRSDALDPRIHQVRRQIGQQKCASAILHELKGYNGPFLQVQDPYSMRCAPQVHGACSDALDYAQTIADRELNAATDNPLVFAEDKTLLSGGNFHGEPLAMAFDFAGIAVAEIGSISERRLELLLNPHMSGLSAFLTPYEGTHSGYMAAQYLSASLVNENKILASPACVDSIPGNVGVEDHVSMGMTSARKLRKIVENCRVILAIELLAAAQAIDIRKVKPKGKGTIRTYNALRKKVKTLIKDRIIADDVAAAVELLKEINE